MSLFSQTIAFGVGQTSQPARISRSLVFGVKGFGIPRHLQSPLSFATLQAEANALVFDGVEYHTSVSRTWTGTEWYPPV